MTGILRLVRIALTGIAGLSLLAMMIHVSVDVVSKNIFNRPIAATIEISSFYYMVLVVFLPLAMVEAKNQHVAVDLFVDMLPAWTKRWVFIFATFVGALFLSCLAWRTIQDALSATRSGETAMANFIFYIWPSRWALPVGFLAMALTLFEKLVALFYSNSPETLEL